jgi:hypothetical protein
MIYITALFLLISNAIFIYWNWVLRDENEKIRMYLIRLNAHEMNQKRNIFFEETKIPNTRQ